MTFSEFRVGVFLLDMFLVLSWAGLEMGFPCFAMTTSPLSVGAGLGNRATLLWLRTRCRNCGLDLGGFWRIPCFCSSHPTDPPPLGSWGRSGGKLTTPTGVQDHLAFYFSFSLFRRHFLALPPLRVIWLWLSLTIYSYPLRLGLPFFLFFDVPCRLRYLAVQRRGSGF